MEPMVLTLTQAEVVVEAFKLGISPETLVDDIVTAGSLSRWYDKTYPNLYPALFDVDVPSYMDLMKLVLDA